LLREVSASFGLVLRESITRAKVSIGQSAGQLVVSLDPMYNTAGRAKEIETALQERIGSALRIRVEVGAAGKPTAHEPGSRRSTYSERLSEASRDPLVQEAIDVFSARVIRVDES
jgi:hypothetical protein